MAYTVICTNVPPHPLSGLFRENDGKHITCRVIAVLLFGKECKECRGIYQGNPYLLAINGN